MKIKWMFLVFLMSSLLMSCQLGEVKRPVDEETKYIHQVLGKTSRAIAKRYNVHCCAFGMAAMNEVEKLMLDFTVDRKLSKDEIREMLIGSVHEMVKNVRECEGIQPYLLKDGFSEKNVEIIFFLHDGKKTIHTPDIATAACYRGNIEYNKRAIGKTIGFISEETETYQEAIAILKEQGKEEVLHELKTQ